MAGKQMLAIQVRDDSDLTLAEAARSLELMVNAIHTLTRAGKAVKIRGFGKFEIVERKPRVGRNMITGEQVPIAAVKVLSFKELK